jgi:hypothetical protein
MKANLNESTRLQKLAGINEDDVINSIPEIQKYFNNLRSSIPKVKGIDTKEVENIVALIDTIIAKLGKGSIGPAIKATTDMFNNRTKNLG